MMKPGRRNLHFLRAEQEVEMPRYFDNETVMERVVLVGIQTPDDNVKIEASLDELEALAQTAGAITVGRLIQNLDHPHPGTYIGKGKISELSEMIEDTGATGIICDDELSPAQMSNLEQALDTKVMDRTLLILDIFARRAVSSEGSIQVELAQLRYRATRLTGFGRSMSRLGGGIGTRGPGEKKLEVDRRLIRERISRLKEELEGVKRHREVSRVQRERSGITVAAIVGYTNAGKSTLLNTLTDANVLEEDQLFATLDPTTRSLLFESGQQILLTDTVGFIHKLPHHLIDAFRSTLEEAKYADILIHVVDASDPEADMHMKVVYETLSSLKVGDKPLLTVFNKIDMISDPNRILQLHDPKADAIVHTSIRYGNGLDQLLAALEKMMQADKLLIERVFDYKHAGDIAVIRKYGQLLEERYQEDGIYVKAYVPKEIYAQLSF